MGVGLMESSQRIKRQAAFAMLASEFSSSTLNEKGSGEFDPSFVITKLGAKVNRIFVAGLLERLEIRETSNGMTMYQGQLRDPSGVHYFSIGDYNSEILRELASDWAERVNEGEPILLMMTAKTRWYQSDDGAVYTSLRPEEACEVTRDTYAQWLLDACEQTVQRMNAYTESLELEPTQDAYGRSSLPPYLKDGLLASRMHYGEVDIETFKLNVMQSLDIAEGKLEAATTPPPTLRMETIDEDDVQSGQTTSIESYLIEIIQHFDQGDGVDFATVVKNAVSKGYVRDDAEVVLDQLVDSGQLTEPRFGWFKFVTP